MESLICPPIGGRVENDLPLVERVETDLSFHWLRVESVLPLVARLGITSHWWRGWESLRLTYPSISGGVETDLSFHWWRGWDWPIFPLLEGLRVFETDLSFHWWRGWDWPFFPLVEGLRLTYLSIGGRVETDLSFHWRRGWDWPILPLVEGLRLTYLSIGGGVETDLSFHCWRGWESLRLTYPSIGGGVEIDLSFHWWRDESVLSLVARLRMTYLSIDGEFNLSSHCCSGWERPFVGGGVGEWPILPLMESWICPPFGGGVGNYLPLMEELGMTSHWWRSWDWTIHSLMESWICPPIGGRFGNDLQLVEWPFCGCVGVRWVAGACSAWSRDQDRQLQHQWEAAPQQRQQGQGMLLVF